MYPGSSGIILYVSVIIRYPEHEPKNVPIKMNRQMFQLKTNPPAQKAQKKFGPRSIKNQIKIWTRRVKGEGPGEAAREFPVLLPGQCVNSP